MMDKQFLSRGYDRQTFARFLDDFLPDDFVREQKSLDMSGYKQNFLSEATRLGKCKSLDLEVYEVRHTSLNDARVGISRDAFNLLLHHSFCNRALIAFVPSEGEQWRFSLLEMNAEVSDTTNRIKRSYSNPRRFSFLLGRGAKTKTPEQYIIEKGKIHERAEGNKPLSAWDDLKSRFSVEVLTKEFYDQLFHWFLWAIDSHTGVTFPNRTETADDDYEQKPERIIRLITRLLFVWFIKQKNLIPDDIFEPNRLKNILSDFQPESNEVGTYYNAILQNLFFATLNQEINDRKFINDFKKIQDKYSVKSLYRDDTKQTWFRISHEEVMKLFHRVPYMNSALFECLDIFELTENNLLRPVHYFDGFSSNGTRDRATGHYKYRAFIPDSLFFSGLHEETVTLDPSSGETIDIKVQGIINIFKEYNFTIEENTPADVQVSLDPELLGRVFENLLAAYNPETGTTARKATGSFYTPREIVDYMVEESLVAHLASTCGTEHTDTIRALVKHNEIVEESNAEFSSLPAEQIISSLKTLRILDPACGSGAFPMGCLLKICSIIETLQPENHDRYQTKLDVIKSCIYGVDIQPIAMMISKLRFFISLLCEQEPKLDDEANNYGIDPLPNLDTKFVAANSLISPDIHKYKGALLVDDDKLNELNDELLEIRNEYVTIRTKSGKKNNRLREEAKRNEIEQYILVQSGAPDQDKIARLQQEIAKNEAELPKYQGEKIVETKERIQNLFGDVTERVIRKDINKEKRDLLTAAIRRCQQEIQREKNKQNPVGFAAAVQQVTKWNPFDQNQTSPYFDPEWMFGIHGGFDIVIGNPPYVQLQNDGGKYATLYEPCGYETFARTGDMYCLFYERGWQNLKAGGRLCYITSNKWMRAGYGEKTREFFANKTNPQLLIDFAGVKIFESATVDTNILLFEKSANTGSTLCCIAKKLDKKGSADLSLFVKQNSSICDFHTSDSWVILSPIEQSIKRKIEAVGTPLKDWDIQINYGIKTGFNDAFIISTEKRNQLLSACKSADERKRTEELIRPILRGRDIKRYGYDWANLWLIYIPWHFPMQFDNSIQGASPVAEKAFKDQYPVVYAHMLQYKKELSARNKAETGIRYEWYAMQRWGSNYWEDFDKPKVVYMEIQTDNRAEGYPFPCFSYDEKRSVILNTGYIMVSTNENLDVKYVLGVLNSSFGRFLTKLYVTQLQERQFRMLAQYVSTFPIPKVSKSKQDAITQLVNKELKAHSDMVEQQIDELVFDLYQLTEDEKDFIRRR